MLSDAQNTTNPESFQVKERSGLLAFICCLTSHSLQNPSCNFHNLMPGLGIPCIEPVEI